MVGYMCGDEELVEQRRLHRLYIAIVTVLEEKGMQADQIFSQRILKRIQD